MVEEFIPLKLAKGLYCHISRIGYPDEGIRVTFLDAVPYNLHFEVQLSRTDAEWMIAKLQDMLKSERQDNLPK